jgi:hypothetical protein
MEKDRFESSAGLAAETGHCDNASQESTEIASPPLQALPGGYEASRFNALRHGVLSKHTVLSWEDKAEYEALLSALVQEHAPHGPTEEHLVEEIAGVIWRKRRLRLAEGASHRIGLEAMAWPWSKRTILRAGLDVDSVMFFHTGAPWRKIGGIPELERRYSLAQKAVAILDSREADAFDAALAELDESTRWLWEDHIAPESEDVDQEEDPDEDLETYTADAKGLARYLRGVLSKLAEDIGYVENQHQIREQVLGESLQCDKLEQLNRYEVQLDRKLERMLAMLLRLQSLRRSNEAG